MGWRRVSGCRSGGFRVFVGFVGFCRLVYLGFFCVGIAVGGGGRLVVYFVRGFVLGVCLRYRGIERVRDWFFWGRILGYV